MGNGGNFEVPQEVLAVLPSDPYEQLDLARRITAMALAEKLSKLEGETRSLRAKLAEKDLIMTELQERAMDAEASLQETTSRLSAVLDDHSKLSNEKTVLVNTVKKLNRDVAKLETFKRTLMQSLQDDGDDHKAGFSDGHSSSFSSVIAASNAAASVESKKYNNGSDSWQTQTPTPSSRASVVEQEEQAETYSTPVQESNEVKHVEIDTSGPKQQQQLNQTSSVPSTPHPTTQQQPAPAPATAPTPTSVESSRWQSSSGSPERPPAAERPPPVESKLTIPLSLPSSRSTTAPNSPPNVNSTAGRTPRVDGKEFFRQARNRLSYEQFSAFLANIKELNAHRQTREETLKKADRTFGPENKDLYIAFDGLLSRHLST